MAGLRAAGGLGGRMAMSALKTAANQTAPMRGLNKAANALVGQNGLLTGGNAWGMNGSNTSSAVQALKAFKEKSTKGSTGSGNSTINASKGSTTNNSAFSFGNASGGANGGGTPGGSINPGGGSINGGASKTPHTTVSKDTQTSTSESVNTRNK